MLKYYRKKYCKYLYKVWGGTRYLELTLNGRFFFVNQEELDKIKEAFNSGETQAVYADTDSVRCEYPSVMKTGRFPLVNQPGSK